MKWKQRKHAKPCFTEKLNKSNRRFAQLTKRKTQVKRIKNKHRNITADTKEI